MAKALFIVLILLLSLSDSVFSEQEPDHDHDHHYHHHHQAPAPPKPPCQDQVPSLAPAESPIYFPSDSPVESPIYFSSDSPAESPIYFSSDSPVESPIYFSSDSPADSPIQIWSDSPYYPPADSPVTVDGPTPAPDFPRSRVAVRGVVYCMSMSCKYPYTFQGATPLEGAVVKLRCKNSWFRRPTVTYAETDKTGFFYLEAPRRVTSYSAHTCKVKLVMSPLTSCSQPTGFLAGPLRPVTHFFSENRAFTLYSVGPLAFGPTCKPN